MRIIARTSIRRPQLMPVAAISILLLLAILPLPYGYYIFLRWVTCGMAVFTAYIAYQWGFKWAIWVFIPLAILFNPIFPIYLTKEIWQPIDIITATIFIASLSLRRKLKDVSD